MLARNGHDDGDVEFQASRLVLDRFLYDATRPKTAARSLLYRLRGAVI